jgi:threonine dehydratase
VLIGLELPHGDECKLMDFLDRIGYRYLEQTDDPVYQLFL